MINQWLRSCFLVMTSCTLLTTDLSAQAYSPRIGERHVDFTLPSIDNGKPIRLSQYRGKKVLLIQFASW